MSDNECVECENIPGILLNQFTGLCECREGKKFDIS